MCFSMSNVCLALGSPRLVTVLQIQSDSISEVMTTLRDLGGLTADFTNKDLSSVEQPQLLHVLSHCLLEHQCKR